MPLTLSVVPTTIEIGEKFVNLFRAVRKKLMGDPEKAFDKLAEVTAEINKFYESVAPGITSFISLNFSPSGDEQQNRQALYNILGGSMQVKIEHARGHCGRIGKIYAEYLDKWFKKQLTPGEYKQAALVFMELSAYDDDMIAAASALEMNLQQKSRVLLERIDAGDYQAAVALQKTNQYEFLPLLQKLSRLMQQLVILRNEFMEQSNTI